MFGTDGVRGLANRALTAQLALDLGDAAVRVLGDDGDKSEFDGRRRALVGRDTRVSGDFLAAALSAGMSAGGFDVIDAGIIPTPGVAYLTSVLNVEMGAVISASHNPMPDNGIKFFARGGFKLPDTKEDEIENVLGQDWERPTGAGVGRISHDTATATNLYIDHLVSTIAPIGPDKSQPTPLKGLKVVADCANGATSVVAPEALRRAGADVIVINASPDGYNINKNAGSTHPEQLQAMVKASGADLATLIGTDAGKSARTIANEELAAQLIPEGAQEALDTLTEIAQWIQDHPNDASAMNAAITKLSQLAGVEGIAVQTNPIANSTLINFGNDADGNVISVTLAGIVDPALVNVTVI